MTGRDSKSHLFHPLTQVSLNCTSVLRDVCQVLKSLWMDSVQPCKIFLVQFLELKYSTNSHSFLSFFILSLFCLLLNYQWA